jgi:hypothetical protein
MKHIRFFSLAILLLTVFTIHAQDRWQTWYEKSGGLETPRYDETYRFSRMLADSSKLITMVDYGKSPQGRAMFALVLDHDGLSDPAKIRAKGRVILFVEACIHPGEPEGKDAGLLFFRDVAIKGLHRDLLEKVSVLFIPIVNVDGHERFSPYNRINQNGPKEMGWRTTASNLNLNRDFLKADAPEMIAWLALFNRWMPDFFMDIHTTDGADYQYIITYSVEDAGNLSAGLTHWLTDIYVPSMVQHMNGNGMPVFSYVTFTRWHDPRSGLHTRPASARYSVGYVTARNRPGILIETHMLKPYKPRVEASLEMIRLTASIMAQDPARLAELNQSADLQCTGGDLLKQPFTLTWKMNEKPEQVSFKGYSYQVMKSELTGNDWFIYSDTPQTFAIDWYHDNIPDKTILLPQYYIIPAEWSDVIQRLTFQGVRMRKLTHDTTLVVSAFKFSEVKFATQPYEGRMGVINLNCKEFITERTFPPGSVIIPMRQQAAKLIAYALEPESPESFLQWGFFNAIFEQKEYAESYVMEKLAREMIAKDPSLLGEFNAFNATLPENPGKIWMQYNWWYEHTPYFDTMKNVYPVGLIR